MPDRPLAVLQLTHQGGPAGSTQSIFDLSEQLARRGHRVLVGCRDDVLLARLARRAGLDVVPLDFTRLGSLARALEGVIGAVAGSELAAARATLGDVADRSVLAVVSRLKDQHVVVQALPLIERPMVVAFVGVEPNARLRALADAVPSRHRVVFVPLSERPALPFYHLATAAALPSRIEGLSQSLLEAMALGLPVVASDAGGNPHLVTSGETGLLVPPLDPAAWARALDRVLSDGEFARRLARAGRELVRREFTLERTAQRTEAVYREAVERRARAG